jgi:transposase-like protein
MEEIKCPRCNSNNIKQTNNHNDSGFNGYICNDCNCCFGN